MRKEMPTREIGGHSKRGAIFKNWQACYTNATCKEFDKQLIQKTNVAK